MNQLVISLVEAGKCPVCGGLEKVQVRRPAVHGQPGGLVGFVRCPLSDPGPLMEWVQPYLESTASTAPPNGVA